MDTTDTPTQRLASLILGQPIRTWIASRRAEGSSWRAIAAQLNTETRGEIDITHEAVRSWHDTEAVAS